MKDELSRMKETDLLSKQALEILAPLQDADLKEYGLLEAPDTMQNMKDT